jgi:hypothetical protein
MPRAYPETVADDDPFGICSDSAPVATTAPGALRRWLTRQLRQPTPEREHLEAAVAADDPDEVRRLLARVDFSPAQKRYAEDLLQRWEES